MISLIVTGALAFMAAGGGQALATEPMRRLSVLLGTWDVEDVYQPASGTPERETGVRTCGPALAGRYIECVTHARNGAGRQREYRWLINFNTTTERYDFVGVFSNYSGKDLKFFNIDSSGRTWNFRSAETSTDDGIQRWFWATLVFETDDRAVWTGYRNAETDAPQVWVQTSRDTWIRRGAGGE